jgi:hypothetical protein
MADNRNKNQNNQGSAFDANSINEMLKGLDLNALQNMLSNIDMNEVASLASKINNQGQNQPLNHSQNSYQNYQIPPAYAKDPIVAVLNSIKPFIPREKWGLVDELIRLLGVRAAINYGTQNKR